MQKIIAGALFLLIIPSASAQPVYGPSGPAPLQPSSVGIAATGQVPGTATNDDAAAGKVGEYQVATLAQGSAISLTSGIVVDVTSVSLTAGDWDVDGVSSFNGDGTTVVNNFQVGINSTSATLPTVGTMGRIGIPYGTAGIAVYPQGRCSVFVGPVRMSLAATTTIYLVASSTFGTSTSTVHGQITARRVR